MSGAVVCCVHLGGAKPFQGWAVITLPSDSNTRQSRVSLPNISQPREAALISAEKQVPASDFSRGMHSTGFHSTSCSATWFLRDVSVGLGTPLQGAASHPPVVERAPQTHLALQGELGRGQGWISVPGQV